MTITVRIATPADTPFIEELGALSSASSISLLRRVPADVVGRSFRRLFTFCLEQAATVVFAAEADGRRAGFLILLTDLLDDVTQQPQAFIAYMAVEPELRAAGIGRALLQAAQVEAQRRSLPHLSLMVSADNATARGLYRSFGFQKERLQLTKKLAPA